MKASFYGDLAEPPGLTLTFGQNSPLGQFCNLDWSVGDIAEINGVQWRCVAVAEGGAAEFETVEIGGGNS